MGEPLDSPQQLGGKEMRHSIIIAAIMAAAQGSAAAAGAPQVEQGLSFLVGEWTIAGYEGRYLDSCKWFDDHAFVVCDTMDGRHGTPRRHVAALGWSAATGNYTYLGYATDGSSQLQQCFANDQKGVTCLGEQRDEKGYTQIRSYIWPTPTGLGIRQERSLNGAPFKEVGQVAYIPKK
jgi:hypothetical protein